MEFYKRDVAIMGIRVVLYAACLILTLLLLLILQALGIGYLLQGFIAGTVWGSSIVYSYHRLSKKIVGDYNINRPTE